MHGTYLCAGCQQEHGSFHALLRGLTVLDDKHIPASYLRASEADRRDLLAGLLDTDGTVVKGLSSVQFAVTSRRLADDVHELIVSLGYRCGRTTKRVKGRTEASSTCYILNFSTVDDVDTPSGRLALALVLAGAPAGDYGVKTTARAPLPKFQPAGA